MPRPATRRIPSRDLALIAVFAGVTQPSALYRLCSSPGSPHPSPCSRAVLGARRGTLAVLLFLALVALGLPLLAGGRGGLGVFATPYAGFLWAFPLAALTVGYLTEQRGAPYRLRWGIPFNIVGSLVLYLGGWISLMVIGGSAPLAGFALLVIYIPADLVKMCLAALLARGVHQALPDLLPTEPASTPEVRPVRA